MIDRGETAQAAAIPLGIVEAGGRLWRIRRGINFIWPSGFGDSLGDWPC